MKFVLICLLSRVELDDPSLEDLYEIKEKVII